MNLTRPQSGCTLSCVHAKGPQAMSKKDGKIGSESSESTPIGERLRSRRVGVLGKSVREIAKLLSTAPVHVSDIETGRRAPSEELLLKIAEVYGMPLPELRAGFSRPDAVVAEIASESTVAAEKVPAFLRKARGFSAEQWDQMIKQASKMKQDRETR